MKTLRGIPVSHGIAEGSAFIHADDEVIIPNYVIPLTEIEDEWARFLEALDKARHDITSLRDRADEEMGREQAAIFDSHLLMLDDPDLMERLESDLRSTLRNMEFIVSRMEQEIATKMAAGSDSYLRERSLDVRDVSRRLINHLLKREKFSIASLRTPCILVTHNLLPSDIIAMDRKAVRAIVMDQGGKTSHTAILARAFGIPAVLGLGNATHTIAKGEYLIVDGAAGMVIVSPDELTSSSFAAIRLREERRADELRSVAELPAETTDGYKFTIKANIEVPEETLALAGYGAEGIGLFRSEFLFIAPHAIPDEEQQFKAYKGVIEAMCGKPVTIRTLDVGGDKVMPEMGGFDEKNPLLGWRAIRFCLANETVFLTQLKAILRASAFGSARIMFPMISGPDELDAALAMLERAKALLRTEGKAFDEAILVGIMIEIPSAALSADILAKKVSFFSIGTNDLIQYTMAVDRGNEKVAYLHEPFHLSVIRLIKMTIDAAHAAGITVGMCGEMASDPLAAILLIGLGLDEFSMSARGIPEIKKLIRSLSKVDSLEIARKALTMGSGREIERVLLEEASAHTELGNALACSLGDRESGLPDAPKTGT